MTLGGFDGGAHATLKSGAGLIILSAEQTMTAQTSYPDCITNKTGTAETSNVYYGELCATPSTMFSQAFWVEPVTT
jgi:hypothetical protein